MSGQAYPIRHDPLTRLAIRHGSDKFGGHLYTPAYHELLASLRELPIKLLEIGVGGYTYPGAGGLSLRMWADYFPYGTITGLDIHHKDLDLPPRVRVVQGSQVDFALLDRLSADHGPFDVVVDDGSHMVPHAVRTFQHLFPLMAPTGIYIVEDTQTSFKEGAGGRRDGARTIFELAHRLALAMHSLEGYVPPDATYGDLTAMGRMTASVCLLRNAAVFKRGSNTYPSNFALSFDNAEVVAVYDGIAAEAAANPSPMSSLSRIDMDIWAGRHDRAAAAALEAARRYPDDVPLLHELHRMMEWANQPGARDLIGTALAGAVARHQAAKPA